MEKEKNLTKGNISYKSFQKMLKMQAKELKFEQKQNFQINDFTHYNYFLIVPQMQASEKLFQLIENNSQKQIQQAPKNMIKLQNIEQIQMSSKTFSFLKNNNVQLRQHLKFCAWEHINLGLQTVICSKNNYGSFVLNPYIHLYDTNSISIKLGKSMGARSGFDGSIYKKLNDNYWLGFSVNIDNLKSIQQENVKINLQNSRNGQQYSLQIGNSSYMSFQHKQHINQQMSVFVKPSLGLFKYQNNLSQSNGQIRPNLDLGLTINRPKINSKFKLVGTTSSYITKIKLTLQYSLSKLWKLIISIESQGTNVLCFLGFGKKKFIFAFPVYYNKFNENNVFQILSTISLGGIAIYYVLNRLILQSQKEEYQQKKSQKQMAIQRKQDEELLLIERKAKENHLKEKQKNGLIIIQAYYGQKEVVQELMKCKEKVQIFLNMDQEKKKKILDVTNALRFQINDSSLHLIDRQKKNLIGIADPFINQQLTKVLYINYSYQGIQYDKVFTDQQEVFLPEQF